MKMPDKPKVFISSTLRNFKHHRKALYDLVQDQSGMSPWCFEINGSNTGLPSLQVLMRQIKDSDLVIAVIGIPYGSELHHEPISITEWELHQAVFHRKKILLYIEESSIERDKRWEALLAILTDQLIGCFVSYFSSIEDLCGKVKRDLSKWRRSRRNTSAININSIQPIRFQDKKIPLSIFRNKLERLEELKKSGLYDDAYEYGLTMFNPSDMYASRTQKELEAYADFFYLFSHILAVQNKIRCGQVSAVYLSKIGFKMRQLLDDKVGMLNSAIAISGILNMAGLPESAESWNAFALQRGQYIADQSEIWDSRGSILRAAGKHSQAEKALGIASVTQEKSEKVLGYILSRLAGIQLSLGKRKSAFKTLANAEKYVSKDSLEKAVYIRELSSALIKTGEIKEASNQIHDGIKLCASLGLTHPKKSLQVLALKAGIRVDKGS